MLSRLALRNSKLLCPALRSIQTSTNTPSSVEPERHPERPVRNELPGPVRFGFIPEEWFTFFYPKTGVTGPYVFFGGLGTYLFSKEWYICEHEFYNGLSFIIIWIFVVKKFGKSIGAFADKMINEQVAGYQQSRSNALAEMEEAIEQMEKSKWRAEGVLMIDDAKIATVLAQLETTYRQRINTVYTEVKRRLDYELQTEHIERRVAQKHMLAWVLDNVTKAITPEFEKQTLQQCIVELQGLAKA